MKVDHLVLPLIDEDTELEVEILGEFHQASVVMKPLYDPSGLKMRE